jgi:predicted lipoprotein with Yx(FWY)xxD motif
MFLRRSLLAGGLAAIALTTGAVVAAADSGGHAATAGAARAGATVKVANHGLGRMLVDGRGRTLYLWKADRTNRSVCSGACAAAWPPVRTTGSVKAGSGVSARLLHVFKRSDGTRQVSYAGHPLYLFAGDSAAGQANGQGSNGFGALWWVVNPRGAAITKAR